MSLQGNFDWGTHGNEHFLKYIKRIEEQINTCLKAGEVIDSYILFKLLEIFEDVIHGSFKLNDINELLIKDLGRQATQKDLNLFISLMKDKIRWLIDSRALPKGQKFKLIR